MFIYFVHCYYILTQFSCLKTTSISPSIVSASTNNIGVTVVLIEYVFAAGINAEISFPLRSVARMFWAKVRNLSGVPLMPIDMMEAPVLVIVVAACNVTPVMMSPLYVTCYVRPYIENWW